jgi:hypothetical protein
MKNFLLFFVMIFSAKLAFSQVFFEANFETDASDWTCSDGQLSGFSAGFMECGSVTDLVGFTGDVWRMGPGRNGGNAVYSWKVAGSPVDEYDRYYLSKYNSMSNRWFTGNDIKTEIYHRWYMKVPPANEYNKVATSGFKFFRYITRENKYTGSPSILVQGPTGGTFANGNFQIYNTATDYLPLTAISNFNDGKWHCHELRIRIQSASGTPDGLIQYWLDGVLTATHTGLDFSNGTPNQAIHRAGVGIGNTTETTDWYQEEWSAIAFDDIVISTEYVGPDEAAPRSKSRGVKWRR